MTNGIAPIPSNRPNVLQDNQYRIVGHWNADLLEGKNGEQISAAAINFHDGTFKRINSYQFIQKEPGKCILIVVPGGNSISEKDIERIGRSVSRKFGGSMDVEVRMAPDVILTDRGKYKMVIKLPKTHRGGG